MLGENGADFGNGRGPWTVHVSFNPEEEREGRPEAVEFGDFGASSSRYADPEAEGVTPVFKTTTYQYMCIKYPELLYIHIFLRTFGFLDRVGLSERSSASFARYLEKIGAAVPPEGPFILLRSVILNTKT